MGILLLLVGSLISPAFVADKFSISGTLNGETERAIQLLRICIILMGIFVSAYSFLSLFYSSKLNAFYHSISRFVNKLEHLIY